MLEDHGGLSCLSFLCVHTSAMRSVPGREPGATFQPLPVPQRAQSQNPAAALTSSAHIPVQAKRSALAVACPGEERYFGI